MFTDDRDDDFYPRVGNAIKVVEIFKNYTRAYEEVDHWHKTCCG